MNLFLMPRLIYTKADSAAAEATRVGGGGQRKGGDPIFIGPQGSELSERVTFVTQLFSFVRRAGEREKGVGAVTAWEIIRYVHCTKNELIGMGAGRGYILIGCGRESAVD